jgi:hypothetical protein
MDITDSNSWASARALFRFNYFPYPRYREVPNDSAAKENLLSTEWEDFSDYTSNSRKSSKKSKIAWSILLLYLVSSFGFICYLSFPTLKQQTQTPISKGNELGECGSTIQEARSLGCKFDPMSWIWVQPACYQADLIDDFLNRTDWHFYLDGNTEFSQQTEVPMEEWVGGDHKVLFADWKYHVVHCTYVWRKMHEAMEKHMPVDNEMMEMHHTKHCGMELLDEWLHEDQTCARLPDGEPCLTRLQAGFTSCGYY